MSDNQRSISDTLNLQAEKSTCLICGKGLLHYGELTDIFICDECINKLKEIPNQNNSENYYDHYHDYHNANYYLTTAASTQAAVDHGIIRNQIFMDLLLNQYQSKIRTVIDRIATQGIPENYPDYDKARFFIVLSSALKTFVIEDIISSFSIKNGGQMVLWDEDDPGHNGTSSDIDFNSPISCQVKINPWYFVEYGLSGYNRHREGGVSTQDNGKEFLFSHPFDIYLHNIYNHKLKYKKLDQPQPSPNLLGISDDLFEIN